MNEIACKLAKILDYILHGFGNKIYTSIDSLIGMIKLWRREDI